jgi:hypothetical protein
VKAEIVVKGKKFEFPAEEIFGHPVPKKGMRVFDIKGVKILTDQKGKILTDKFEEGSRVVLR